MQAATTIKSCRSCGAATLNSILSLGRTPLANALLTPELLHKPEACFALDLVFCPTCSLVQITETVPAELLFSSYLYFSSFSDTIVRSAHELAERLVRERGLNAESLVVEIASNDGYLLQHYRAHGVPVLGIEPATNVAKAAVANGVPTRCAFFGLTLAAQLASEGACADLLHANNVLAHVADLNGFVAGIAAMLKPGGMAIVEVPYVKDLIEKCEFDTIYHEHLCYFSLTALERLFVRHRLAITDMEHIPVHGGSLRIFATPAAGMSRSPRLEKALRAERALGMLDFAYYSDFSRRIEILRAELVGLLRKLRGEGRRLAAYGASAKGSTLLNVFGIGRNIIDFVVDRSTVKQGHFTPGTHLPIVAPEALLQRQPDYVLLLTWNFADEILAQQAGYRAQGGRFIIPIPEPRII